VCTKKLSNGAGRVPSVILPVKSVDKTNITPLVNGTWLSVVFGTTKAKFCQGVPKKGPCK
jgi:hypothetical protein